MITAVCKNFVDDSRSVTATQNLVRDDTHRVETVLGYLGLQGATRKRIPNPQTPGKWKGFTTLALDNVGLFVTVSERKWDRAKEIIRNLLEKSNDPDHFP